MKSPSKDARDPGGPSKQVSDVSVVKRDQPAKTNNKQPGKFHIELLVQKESRGTAASRKLPVIKLSRKDQKLASPQMTSANPLLAGAVVDSTDAADPSAAEGGGMSKSLEKHSHAEGESDGKDPPVRARIRVIKDLGRPGRHPLDWRAITTDPVSVADGNASDTDTDPGEGVDRKPDKVLDALPEDKDVKVAKRGRARPRIYPLDPDSHVSKKQVPPTVSPKPAPVQSKDHGSVQVADQSRMGLDRKPDKVHDDLPKDKDVKVVKRGRGRPRIYPLDSDSPVSKKQVPPTLSRKAAPVQSKEHGPEQVVDQPPAERTIVVQVLREDPLLARPISKETEVAELIPEDLQDRPADALNAQDKIGNFEIRNAKPANKIPSIDPESADLKEKLDWGPASPPGLDISKPVLCNFIGESTSKRQELAKLKASYVRVSRQVQFWQDNPDWTEPTIPEEELDGSSTPGRLLALREFVLARKEEPDEVMPLDALVAMHPRQAWKAVTDLHLQLLRLKMELLYSRIQVKFRDLRLLKLTAKHRRLKNETSSKERKWKRSDAYKGQLIEKLDRRLEVFTDGTLAEKEEAEKKKRKWDILWKKMEKIFTPVQLTRLRTGKRRKWQEEDLRRGIELRKMVTPRGYGYIRRVMKIPLPGVVVLRNASTRFPILKGRYEQMVAANMLAHCTKKKSAAGKDPVLGLGDEFPMPVDEDPDDLCESDVHRTAQSSDLLDQAPLMPADPALYRSLHMPLDASQHATPHRPPSISRGRPPPAKRRKKAAPPDSGPFGFQLAPPETGESAPWRPARRGRPRGRPRGRGAAPSARRDVTDWDAAELLWDDMRSADSAPVVRKTSWTPARVGSG